MRVLIACECSGIVREAFAKRGHVALSCDPVPTELPGNHIRGDVRVLLDQDWDLMVAFPPCTHLAVSGARYFRGKELDQAASLDFVRELLDAPIKKIALENPVGVISTKIRKPDQIIQPFQFGHCESKKTCLWLKGLPLLAPTEIVPPSRHRCKCGEVFDTSLGKCSCPTCGESVSTAKPVYDNQTGSGQNKLGPGPDRAKNRSRTYAGIAAAMAAQWG